METATLRTSYSAETISPPRALLAGGCLAASFALVGVLYGPITGGVLFGIVALALSMWSLEFGLALLFLVVILFNAGEIRSISIPFFGGGLRPTDVVTAVILAGWMWRMAMGKAMHPLPRRILLPVLAFVGLGIVSVLFGIRNGADYKDSLLELRPILSYLLVLPVAKEFRWPQIKRMVWLVILASWVAAIHSVLIYAKGSGDAGGYTLGRMRVMEIEYPFVLLAFLIVLSMYIHRVWRGLAPVLCMISLLAGLAVTFYRSAFLALAASLVLIYCLADRQSRQRWRRDAVRVAAFILVAALADSLWVGQSGGFVAALGTRIWSIDDYDNDVSAQHRLNEWNAALHLYAENPVLGAGLGTRVQFHSPMYSDDEKPREGYWSDDFYIHNAYIWIATKMGTAGLVIYLFLFATALKAALTVAWSSTNPEERGLLIGIIGALVSLIVLSMFGPTVFTINQAPFAAFVFAIAYKLSVGDASEKFFAARSLRVSGFGCLSTILLADTRTMKFLLFDWTIEGHHARYLRCFAETLSSIGEVVVAVPPATASAVEDLPVRVAMLPSSRPPVDPCLPLGPQHRRLATSELEFMESVVNDVQPDHLIHLSADPIIRQLVKHPSLKVPTTLFLFCPRAHYPSVYNTPLSAKERLRAWFLEYLVARWRHRPDAHTILTLDLEAARRWARGRGGAHWVPEPPIGPLPDLPSDGHRSGCILYGSLAKRKGIHLLARAIALGPVSLDVTLAGAVEPGFYEELCTYIEQIRTSGAQVHLQTNLLTESEGLRALAGARCAVLPYPQHYSMSRVLVEACSVGTPVIVHHRGLLGHLVRQNHLGMALDCLDSTALRHGLLSFCAEDLSSQYADAHARFVRMFSRDAFQQALRRAFAQPDTQASGTPEQQPLAHQTQ